MRQPIWPLVDLQVQTPRLTLRYVSDELANQLALLAAAGIHDPAVQPFTEPWTDVPSPEQERNTLRYYWKCRAETTASHWDLCLAVMVGNTPVGMCAVHADDFPAQRIASTGSWLGQRHQGDGLGKELRQAALHLIFAGFGGSRAVTRVWHDNAASLGVTRSLPYVQSASTSEMRRDRLDRMLEFTMTGEQWETVRRDDIELIGIAAVRQQLELV